MTPAQINELAKEIHVLNRKWWPENIKDRNKSQILILVVSEVTECMEGERKDLMDDKLPHRKMAEVEMADTAIRVLDVMGAFNYQYVEGTDMTDNWSSFDPDPACDTKEDRLFAIVGLITMADRYRRTSTWMSNILYLVSEYCRRYGYDLWGAVREKLEYNKTRYDHTDEGRAAEGGKKW